MYLAQACPQRCMGRTYTKYLPADTHRLPVPSAYSAGLQATHFFKVDKITILVSTRASKTSLQLSPLLHIVTYYLKSKYTVS